MKPETCFRYYQDWKKKPKYYNVRCKAARALFRSFSTIERRIFIEILANELCADTKLITKILRKPWSIKQLVTGEWRDWVEYEPRHKTSRIQQTRIWWVLIRYPKVRMMLEIASVKEVEFL
ncbi:hypothetical protein ACFLUS_03685 [Chloroflexota bacterium]